MKKIILLTIISTFLVIGCDDTSPTSSPTEHKILFSVPGPGTADINFKAGKTEQSINGAELPWRFNTTAEVGDKLKLQAYSLSPDSNEVMIVAISKNMQLYLEDYDEGPHASASVSGILE